MMIAGRRGEKENDNYIGRRNKLQDSSDESDFEDDEHDEEFLALEREEEEGGSVSAQLREKRMAELKAQAQHLADLAASGNGRLTEAADEREILKLTTELPRVLVHFYHRDFKRCKIMDAHLERLAPLHVKTRFVRVSVDKTPFLVEKMKIQILPCIVGFIDGISVDRLIGFEELGNVDDFSTQALEKRLLAKNVLQDTSSRRVNSIFNTGGYEREDDDDDDY